MEREQWVWTQLVCVSSQKTAISWSRQKRGREKTETEAPLEPFCNLRSPATLPDIKRQAGQVGGPRTRGQGQEGGAHCNSHFLLRVPHQKEMGFFKALGSQRGIGDANFISLDPGSFGLQQAVGRKQG